MSLGDRIMAFDEKLASRVRGQLEGRAGIVEKKMFGGLAFLLHGNMSAGVHRDELIVRIAPEATDAALQDPGVRVFDITGRSMRGWLLVGDAGIKDSSSLASWINRAIEYASSLPRK
jgi:TfoX/Sxy family transcriptional regulator of competence genes